MDRTTNWLKERNTLWAENPANVSNPVVDQGGGGSKGAMTLPRPVKIHTKDGHQTQQFTIHVSWNSLSKVSGFATDILSQWER